MRSKRRDTIEKYLFFFVFLIPGAALYLIFYYYPNLASLFYSFFRWNPANPNDAPFIGLDNFEKLYQEREILLKVIGNTLFLSVANFVIGMVISLLVSAILSSERLRNARDVKFYRCVMYLPNIIPPVVGAMLWQFIYSPVFGIFTPVLKAMGFTEIAEMGLLGNTLTVKPAIIMSGIWGVIGYYFVIIFSAMTNVPQDYYDAAAIDGAGAVRKFFSITLPLIKGTIQTLFILAVAQLFSSGFIGILVMTGGGPNRSSEVLSLYMYQQSFGMNNFGYGAAVGTVMLIISIVLYNLATRLVERGDENEG